MSALNPVIPDTPGFWERAAQSIAALHEVTGPRYGWHRDGTLGRLVQENAWDDDGFRFFAERRVLRYLREPKVEAILDAADRAGLERVCARLPELLPPAPPTLTHGDLWRANVIADLDGSPVFIDPSVSYTWPEVDISMLYCTGGVPDTFFDTYYELRPSIGDWRERMDLLHLRELLCIVAHFGTGFPDVVPGIREIVKRFS
jgi:fructosamine-3-kinase